MPKSGKDQYQALPGYEKLRMIDQLQGSFKSTFPETDSATGRVIQNPKREFLQRRIDQRTEEERAAAAAARLNQSSE